MKVLFRNSWFAPNGARYRKGPQDVPEELAAILPKTAEVISADLVKDDATVSLRDFDIERAAGDIEGEVRKRAYTRRPKE